MAVAHCEKLHGDAYLVRVGPPGWGFGEPYDVALVMVVSDGVAEFKGLDKPLTLSQYRALAQVAKDQGCVECWYERRAAGQRRKRNRKMD